MQDDQTSTPRSVSPCEGWHRLPPEIVDLVLNGGAAGGRRYLAPRWRFSAALVCAQWRRCIAAPSSADAEAIVNEASLVVRQCLPNPWIRGTLACVSALSDGLALGDLSLDDALSWLRRARVSDAVAHAVLVASGVSHAIAHARSRFPIDKVHGQQTWPWLAHVEPIADSKDPRLDHDDYYACQARPCDGPPHPVGSWTDILRVACRTNAVGVVEALLGEPHRVLTDDEFALCARDASMRDHRDVMGLLCRHAYGTDEASFNRHRILDLCEMAAAHSAMRSLEILGTLNFAPMRPYDCWLRLDVAAAADAVGVLEWFWRRGGDSAPSAYAQLGLVAAAVMAGALSALDWLVAHFGMPKLDALVRSLDRAVCATTTPQQQMVGIRWLAERYSADKIVPLVYGAVWPGQRRRLAAPLLRQWPLAAAGSIWADVPEMLALGIRQGRWRFVDRLVAAADQALCHGAAGYVCSLWQLAMGDLADAIKGGITPDRLPDLCSALTVLCALAHRTHTIPRATWPLCGGTDVGAPPPLGDVDSETWGRWCGIRRFSELSARVRAHLVRMAPQGHHAAGQALALIAYLGAHT